MMQRDPEDIYKDYEKFRKSKRYDKAYRCLKQLLSEYPKDDDLIREAVRFAFDDANDPALAKSWLIRRIALYPSWEDYVTLSQIEAVRGSIAKARDYLAAAMELEKRTRRGSGQQEAAARRVFTRTSDLIGERELKHKMEMPRRKQGVSAGAPVRGDRHKEVLPKTVSTAETARPDPRAINVPHDRRTTDKKEKSAAEAAATDGGLQPVETVPAYTIPVSLTLPNTAVIADILRHTSSLQDSLRGPESCRLDQHKGFDELLCLGTMKGVERYWYQVETAKRVLKHFRGRVLLGDEVGLGKTIEAGMIIKEYLMRGMIKNALILTPATLVSQWKEEMSQKFDMDFVTGGDNLDSEDLWSKPFVIASIHTAKREGNIERIVERFYDMVVVDEAHHLRNKNTLTWKLVNQIQKKFILLLTATPVQNDLMELFNLITLLKPGQFKTERLFKKEHVKRGDGRLPANKDALRALLKDVIIRNTRSAIDLKLPRRYASTIRLVPTELERQIYEGAAKLIRDTPQRIPKRTAELILREVGSSPHALRGTLVSLQASLGLEVSHIVGLIDKIEDISKGKALMDIIAKNPDEKKVIFTQYLKSMDYVTSLFERHGLAFVRFRGDMGSCEKDAAIGRFKEDIPLLVSTESGGEGRNLQFCNTIINFDLPWNPMRIEQRIGRLHRIGQTRDVFVFNFSARGTIEDHIINILDSKINMFEMVIGEIEPILGHLGEDKEFEDVIMEIWMKSRDEVEEQRGFEELGEKLVEAKSFYLKSRELDRNIFGEDYDV